MAKPNTPAPASTSTPAAKPAATPAPATAPVAPPVDLDTKLVEGINRILAVKKMESKFVKLDEPLVVAVPADMAAFITGVCLKTKTQKDGAVLVLWSATFADGSEKTTRIGWVKPNKAGKVGWHVDEVRVKAPSGVV